MQDEMLTYTAALKEIIAGLEEDLTQERRAKQEAEQLVREYEQTLGQVDETVLLSKVGDTETLYLSDGFHPANDDTVVSTEMVESLYSQLEEKDAAIVSLKHQLKMANDEREALKRRLAQRPPAGPSRHRRPDPPTAATTNNLDKDLLWGPPPVGDTSLWSAAPPEAEEGRESYPGLEPPPKTFDY